MQAAQAAAPSRAGPTPRATRGSLEVALLDKEQQSDAGGIEIDGALWQQGLPHFIMYAGKALIRCNIRCIRHIIVMMHLSRAELHA